MKNIITFNPLKHHLKEIQKFIATPPNNLTEVLKTLGSSQPDLYTGRLSIKEIKKEIIEQLTASQIIDKELFISWIEKAGGYRKLILSDGSKWILRISDNKEQFVHIHPGRYSLYSVRVKSGALKTAIYYLINFKSATNTISTQQINEIRIEVGISPIKNSRDCCHISKLIKIIKVS